MSAKGSLGMMERMVDLELGSEGESGLILVLYAGLRRGWTAGLPDPGSLTERVEERTRLRARVCSLRACSGFGSWSHGYQHVASNKQTHKRGRLGAHTSWEVPVPSHRVG